MDWKVETIMDLVFVDSVSANVQLRVILNGSHKEKVEYAQAIADRLNKSQ